MPTTKTISALLAALGTPAATQSLSTALSTALSPPISTITTTAPPLSSLSSSPTSFEPTLEITTLPGTDYHCTTSAIGLLGDLPAPDPEIEAYALVNQQTLDPCSLTWPARLSSAVVAYDSSVADYVSSRSSDLAALVNNCTGIVDLALGLVICPTEGVNVFTSDGGATTEPVGYTAFPAVETGTGTETETATSGTETTTETGTAAETGEDAAEETGEDTTEETGEDDDSPAGRPGVNLYAAGALAGVLGVAAAL